MAVEVEAAAGSAASLGVAERVLLEESVAMVAHAFVDSHKLGAKLLASMQARNPARPLDPAAPRPPYPLRAPVPSGGVRGVEASTLYVEVLLSLLLTLPAPRHPLAYYGCLLLDLSKLVLTFAPALEAALHVLFARLPTLDVSLATRLAEWAALHISHFGFNLAPFAETWGAAARAADTDAADVGAAVQADFVRHVLSRLVRISYLERVERDCPPLLVPLLPPKPVGHVAWEAPAAGDTEPSSDVALSGALLAKLRNKIPLDEVCEWIDSAIAPDARPQLVMHTLLDARPRSPSHLDKLLEKFGRVLAHVGGAEQANKAAIVAAALDYWRDAAGMRSLVTARLLRHRLVDAAAVLACASAAAAPTPSAVPTVGSRSRRWSCRRARCSGRRRARSPSRSASSRRRPRARWTVMMTTSCRARRSRRRASGRGGCATTSTSCAARRSRSSPTCASARAARSARWREIRAAGGDPTADKWVRAVVGQTQAIARKSLADFSLETVMMVVDGSEGVEAEVQAAVFDGLKLVAAHC